MLAQRSRLDRGTDGNSFEPLGPLGIEYDKGAGRGGWYDKRSIEPCGRGIGNGTDGLDTASQARMRSVSLEIEGPAPRQLRQRVELDEGPDQRLRITAQLDSAQIALRLVLLACGAQHQEADAHRHHAGGLEKVRQREHPLVEERDDRDREPDDRPHRDARAQQALAVEVLEVRDLVREDGGDLVGLEQLEQLVAEENGSTLSRGQCERVDDASAGEAESQHLRVGRPRPGHDGGEARPQIFAR